MSGAYSFRWISSLHVVEHFIELIWIGCKIVMKIESFY